MISRYTNAPDLQPKGYVPARDNPAFGFGLRWAFGDLLKVTPMIYLPCSFLLVWGCSNPSDGPEPHGIPSKISDPGCGTPQTCAEAAKEIPIQGDVAQNARLAQYATYACDHGVLEACAQSALQYKYGTGVIKDETKSLELYRKACDGQLAHGCWNVGLMTLHGLGTAKNEKTAFQYWEKACDGQFSQACGSLADEHAPGGRLETNREHVTAYLKKACASTDLLAAVYCGKLKELNAPE